MTSFLRLAFNNYASFINSIGITRKVIKESTSTKKP